MPKRYKQKQKDGPHGLGLIWLYRDAQHSGIHHSRLESPAGILLGEQCKIKRQRNEQFAELERYLGIRLNPSLDTCDHVTYA